MIGKHFHLKIVHSVLVIYVLCFLQISELSGLLPLSNFKNTGVTISGGTFSAKYPILKKSLYIQYSSCAHKTWCEERTYIGASDKICFKRVCWVLQELFKEQKCNIQWWCNTSWWMTVVLSEILADQKCIKWWWCIISRWMTVTHWTTAMFSPTWHFLGFIYCVA